MNSIKVPSWKLFQYSEVFQIIAWKDGAIFKTKSIGYAKNTDSVNWPVNDNLIFSSISTKLLRQERDVTLSPYFVESSEVKFTIVKK